MFGNLTKLNNYMSKLNCNVQYDMEPYNKVLEQINAIKLDKATDNELIERSKVLRSQALAGMTADLLLSEAFALVREVSGRVLGMRPFDVQMIAGIALNKGKLVEMKTGEGKTLAAVMPAYFNGLTGKGVHVLTFNDYLAERDARWMVPAYEFLGLTAGYVKEGMSSAERQKAYNCDITYVTAKEAGFDYLRDFLCTEKEQLVHRPFNYAIVDEADSIFIDEAGIPLVIAGNSYEDSGCIYHLSSLVKSLREGRDYQLDQHERNIFLTENGLLHVEEVLGCGNLYEQQNMELLTRVNCALHAEMLLRKDRDYIVRNGKIEIVDEFTGRVADKRHWPDNLHSAVEAKEGLVSESKGVVMGSLALQHFLSLYPRLSGMTGTATAAANEFREYYCMDVVVIPTDKPCMRTDHSNMVFTHLEAKKKSVISEIVRVHKTGQPILIGAGSVEESEELAAALGKEGILCNVLNAKNDEMEAKIIAEAGKSRAVTVSTNMAGRGVDIKLGGGDTQDRDKVAALGGLYIIGTGIHESSRVDDQLKGRAGRQGDPGESRFYVSLEDDLFKRFDITKLLPGKCLPEKQWMQLEDARIGHAVEKGQKAVEGYNSDIRMQLWKYSYIVEQQRRIIHKKRQDILMDNVQLDLLEAAASERYSSLCSQLGSEAVRKAEKQLTLNNINKLWTEHLDYVSYVKEGIHLVVIGNKDPLTEFNKLAIQAFDEMLEKLDKEIIRTFYKVTINEQGVDMPTAGLKGPSSTWTYLMNDSPDLFTKLPLLGRGISHFIG